MTEPSEPHPKEESPKTKIKLVAGGVYLLRDSAIALPDSDKAGNRTDHPFRVVILLSNQTVCNSIACPIVTVVPLSSKLTPRAETDSIIQHSAKNGLHYDSRIMFGYMQPILKDEFERQIGEIEQTDWDRIMAKIVWNLDH
ncbi:MAG: type II toxin-antitoxin system PemK/MazF family toxin [Candidatus Sulfotelmatobacter sp.]